MSRGKQVISMFETSHFTPSYQRLAAEICRACGLTRSCQEEGLYHLSSIFLLCSMLFMPVKRPSPPVACSGLKVEGREPCKACFCLSPSCRKGLRGGRLVSAVSQKVTACVRGDAGCYCLTDKKERRKAFRGERKCDGTYADV